MLKNLTEMIGECPILGLVAAGTAVALLVPPVKNVFRGVAVGAAKGVLSITEGGAGVASKMKDSWEDLVSEARSQRGMMGMEPGVVGAGAGGALGATIGSSMGPVGAAVGGGVGGVVGAGVGNKAEDKNNDHTKNN